MPKKTSEKDAPKIEISYLKTGEWLETFLNSKPRYDDYLEMAQDALKILKIDYQITDDDPVFYHIRKIEKKTPADEDIFSNWRKIILDTPIHESHEAIMGVVLPAGGNETLTFLTPSVSVEVLQLPYKAEKMRGILQGLLGSEISWEKAIPKIIDNVKDISEKWGLENFIKDYAGLTDALKIEGGEIRQITKFAEIDADPRPMFRWSTVTAQILFNFLKNGGQNHYSFCERCGKFTVVLRKGRKRFCSDLCRVQEHQEREGKQAKLVYRKNARKDNQKK